MTNSLDKSSAHMMTSSSLAAVMGVLFLEAEPLVGKLVGDRLWGLPAGSTFCAFMSDSCKASSLLHAILLANALVDFTQIRDEA